MLRFMMRFAAMVPPCLFPPSGARVPTVLCSPSWTPPRKIREYFGYTSIAWVTRCRSCVDQVSAIKRKNSRVRDEEPHEHLWKFLAVRDDGTDGRPVGASSGLAVIMFIHMNVHMTHADAYAGRPAVLAALDHPLFGEPLAVHFLLLEVHALANHFYLRCEGGLNCRKTFSWCVAGLCQVITHACTSHRRI